MALKGKEMSGANWLRSCKKELSPFGEQVAEFLDKLYDGIYHIDSEALKSDFSNERYITVTVSDGRGRFSTFDSNLLTKLVLLAHETGIRASIEAATHGYLKLVFMRVDRNGFFVDRHPSLAESMARVGLTLAPLSAWKTN